MNRSTETEQQNENPWKRFAELPKPQKMSLGMAVCLYAVASFLIPIGFYPEWLPWFLGGFLLVGAASLTRRMRSGAVLTLIAAVAAALMSAGFASQANVPPMGIGALVIALCVGVMSGCFFATSTRCWWGVAAISVLAAVIVFAVTRNWLPTVAALSLFPATLLLGIATNMGQYRTTAICYTVGGFLIAAIPLFLLWFRQTNGILNLDAVLNLWNSTREQMIAEHIAVRDAYLDYFRNMLSEGAWSAAQIQSMEQSMELIMQTMSDANLTDRVNLMFNLFPALVFVACAIPAFLAQKMLNAAYMTHGMAEVVTPESEFFTMSVPAAVLFILTTFVTVLFSDSFSIPVTVASNLCIMLLPGFLVVGLRTYRIWLNHLNGGIKGIFLVFSLFFICCSSVGFLVLGMCGAYARVHKAFMRKMAEKMNDGNDGNME